jgi:hypothetical protein
MNARTLTSETPRLQGHNQLGRSHCDSGYSQHGAEQLTECLSARAMIYCMSLQQTMPLWHTALQLLWQHMHRIKSPLCAIIA